MNSKVSTLFQESEWELSCFVSIMQGETHKLSITYGRLLVEKLIHNLKFHIAKDCSTKKLSHESSGKTQHSSKTKRRSRKSISSKKIFQIQLIGLFLILNTASSQRSGDCTTENNKAGTIVRCQWTIQEIICNKQIHWGFDSKDGNNSAQRWPQRDHELRRIQITVFSWSSPIFDLWIGWKIFRLLPTEETGQWRSTGGHVLVIFMLFGWHIANFLKQCLIEYVQCP